MLFIKDRKCLLDFLIMSLVESMLEEERTLEDLRKYIHVVYFVSMILSLHVFCFVHLNSQGQILVESRGGCTLSSCKL